MKKTLIALAVTVFAGSASAFDRYQGWATGNPDLAPQGTMQHATLSAIGSAGSAAAFDRYNGWAANNPDLYPHGVMERTNTRAPVGKGMTSTRAGMLDAQPQTADSRLRYRGFAGNPELI